MELGPVDLAKAPLAQLLVELVELVDLTVELFDALLLVTKKLIDVEEHTRVMREHAVPLLIISLLNFLF